MIDKPGESRCRVFYFVSIPDQFPLTIYVHGKPRPYRMHAELTYESKQVMRFKITGKDRSMVIEKRLLKKSMPWKITETNFDLTGEPGRAPGSITGLLDMWIAERLKGQ